MTSAAERISELLNRDCTTYAADAHITLRNKPAPLYQLSVLVSLLSKPISGDLAVAGARELFAAGYRTPQRMRSATWQERVDALGRGHYRRYDESSSTLLSKSADWLIDTYRGDLRRLAKAAEFDVKRAHDLLQDMPGIGPTGAAIYLREVQAVWQWVRPYADDRVRAAARELRLPHTAPGLGKLAGSDDLSTLGAALIRAAS
jgi:endonuclease III